MSDTVISSGQTTGRDAVETGNPGESRDKGESIDILDLYLKEVARIPVLTPDEESDLAARAARGEQEAVERLVESNARLVVSIANKYRDRGLSLPDLIGAGNLGLIDAAKQFDPERGCRFSSYAYTCIRRAIADEFARSRLIRLPKEINRLKAQGEKVRQSLEQSLGRTPAISEIAEQLNVDPRRLESVLLAAEEPLSLESPVSDEPDSDEMGDQLEDQRQSDPFDTVLRSSMRSDMHAALEFLSATEKQVIRLLYGMDGGEPCSYGEVDKKLNMKSGTAKSIETKALKKLRHPVVRRLLLSYSNENSVSELEEAIWKMVLK